MPDQVDERIAYVYKDHVERILVLLRERLPKVLESNRFFEEETGFHNEAGSNNLVDALSHIGTLAEIASEASYEEQAEEVTHLADHLRRSMMEGFERTLKHRIGQIASLWEEYQRIARPLQTSGELRGPPRAEALDQQRRKIRNLMEEGRSSKRAASWEEWEEGTARFAEACHVANELADDLEQAIGAARRLEAERAGRRLAWWHWALGLAFGAATFGAALLLAG